MKVLSCHQPEIFPALGYWNKMVKSDIFVHLDCVQLQEHGLQNRFLVKNNKWLNVPCLGGYPRIINQTKINNKLKWQEKIRNVLDAYYKGSEFYEYYKGFRDIIFKQEWYSLIDLNMVSINYLLNEFTRKKDITFHRLSFFDVSSDPTQRIIDLCIELGCDTYLSGTGGKNYLDEESFSENNIKLIYNEYKPPDYFSILHHMFTEPKDTILNEIFKGV